LFVVGVLLILDFRRGSSGCKSKLMPSVAVLSDAF